MLKTKRRQSRNFRVKAAEGAAYTEESVTSSELNNL